MEFITNDAAGGDFAPPEPGMENSICTRWIDEGTQKSKNPEYPDKRRVSIVFEMEQKMSDGRPFVVTKWLNLSWHEKSNMRKAIEAWRGKPFVDGEKFSPRQILGKPALLNISINARGYPDIISINPLPKSMQPLTPAGELIYFDLDQYDADIFEQFSEKQQAAIASTPEFDAAHGRAKNSPAEKSGADFDDEIPF